MTPGHGSLQIKLICIVYFQIQLWQFEFLQLEHFITHVNAYKGYYFIQMCNLHMSHKLTRNRLCRKKRCEKCLEIKGVKIIEGLLLIYGKL